MGKAYEATLAFLLKKKWMPFGKRFPIGINFCHDLERFIGVPQMIVDAGAHHGQSAEIFHRFWPSATIHSFEPVPESFAILRARAERMENVHPHAYALGQKEAELHIQKKSYSQEHSLKDLVSSGPGGISVRVQTLDKVSQEKSWNKIDLLKIDVEGFELEALQGAERLLRQKKIRSILAECRFLRDAHSQTLFQELDSFLNECGMYFSGFYEIYRWGPAKAYAAFGNGLWVLPEAVKEQHAEFR
jgi:FkbM family methyltransferase